MHPTAPLRPPGRACTPGQRWLVWLLLQALLALSLATGARAVGGPLHGHGPGAHQHAHSGVPGQLARHHHDADADAQMLDQGAPAPEDLSSSSANAAAAPWLAQAALRVHGQVLEERVKPPPAASWVDAERSLPDRPPPR